MKRFTVRRIASLLVVAALASPRPAHASMFGEENGPLYQLVTQGIAEFAQGAQSLQQMIQMYEETKKYVGMASDAVEGFREFGMWADSIFQQPENALYSVLPEAAYLRQELQSPESWGRGTGELQRLVRVCLSGQGQCAAVKQAVSAYDAQQSISDTFGTVPKGRDDLATVDIEAARAISGSMSVTGRSTVSAEQAARLMQKCMSGSGSEAVQACQSAANIGSLLQVQETAALNQQVAESVRLQALDLARENAIEKRTQQETNERQKQLEAATRGMAPPQIQFIGGEGSLR